MPRVIVVDAFWSRTKAAAVGVMVAATSVALWWGLHKWNEAWDYYEMPDLMFFPLLGGILVVFPIAALARSYRKLPRVSLGLIYVLGFAVGWHLTMETLQAAEYGLWKGLRPSEQTALTLLSRQVQGLSITVLVSVPLGLGTWSLCRLLRGKILIQDGSLCSRCGYSLIGNLSGVCPECGSEVVCPPA